MPAAAVLPSSAADEPPPPIGVELLTSRSGFTDVSGQIKFKLDGRETNVLNIQDLSRTAVAKITVQPGAQYPWHTHPGPVIVNVAEGALTYVQANDCVERPTPRALPSWIRVAATSTPPSTPATT
jgi:predicted metal-dependent enzyme (double-stranded beta helix superfamily)